MSITGKRVYDLRINRGLSQRAVAQRLNMSHTSISQIESGGRVPNAATIKLLADFFHVPADYLLGVDNSLLAKEVIQYDAKYDPIIALLKKLPDKDLEIVKMLIENMIEKNNIKTMDERKRA